MSQQIWELLQMLYAWSLLPGLRSLTHSGAQLIQRSHRSYRIIKQQPSSGNSQDPMKFVYGFYGIISKGLLQGSNWEVKKGKKKLQEKAWNCGTIAVNLREEKWGKKAKPNTLLYLTGKERKATSLVKGNTCLRGSNVWCQGIKSSCREQRKKGKGRRKKRENIKYERVYFG